MLTFPIMGMLQFELIASAAAAQNWIPACAGMTHFLEDAT
jgi:hypothetical protein